MALTDVWVVGELRGPRLEYSRDGQGRWWCRRWIERATPRGTFIDLAYPWSMMGLEYPHTVDFPPPGSVLSPRKTTLPMDYLQEILKG